MEFWRFGGPLQPSDQMAGTYDPALVFLSVLVSCMAGYTALKITDRIAANRDPIVRLRWGIAGGVALGLGIWAMHFTGMMAFSVPGSVRYDLIITLLSIVPAFVGSAAALYYMGRGPTGFWRFQIAASLLAGGIGAMHYTGMEAMIMDANLYYDFEIFVVSLVVAHMLAMLALYVRFAWTNRGRRYQAVLKILSGVIMGCAVAGMHYTAMYAAKFFPGTDTVAGMTFPSGALGSAIAFSAATILGLTVVAAETERHFHRTRAWGRAAHERNKLILDNITEGIVGVDTDANILFINPAARDILGLEQNADDTEFLQDFLKQIFSAESVTLNLSNEPDAFPSSRKNMNEMIQNGIKIVNADISIEKINSVYLPITFSVSPIRDEEGAIEGSVIIFRDATDRMHYEEALIQAKEEAESANQAKSAFLAQMSHDLRTPLNAILGYGQILEKGMFGTLSDIQTKYLDYMMTSGRNMLGLVDDILEVSAADSDQMRLHWERVDISHVIETCIAEVQPLSRKNEVKIYNKTEKAQCSNVETDETRLRQVITNLLTNAIKYNVRGGRADIDAHQDREGVVTITVRDTGKGISEEDKDRIFDAFERVDSDPTTSGGSGIGLAIAKKMTEKLGGRIGVTSEVGVGSAFYVEIPVRADSASVGRPRPARTGT